MVGPQSTPIHTAVFLLLILLLSSAVQLGHPKEGPLLAPPHKEGAHPPMALPLVLSYPNSSMTSSGSPCRHLQGSDMHNARMSLHDDLILRGYYTTRLWIGTPPQNFAMIVDTGSTLTYVPCSTCEHCGNHQDPKFQPELSSTYQPVKCNVNCSCDNDGVQCVYDRHYAELSSSSGVLGEDLVSFGNLSDLPPQRAIFGCENRETGDLYNQHADGIMGMGRGDHSIIDQLVGKGVISDSSLCYGGMETGGGSMILGGFSQPSGMVFTHSDPTKSPYYNIDLMELHVGGKPLTLNPKVFNGSHGSVLDSGTTYAYLDSATLLEISQLASSFPAVDFVFGNGQKLTLSPENYLFQHSKVPGAYCLGIFQNERDSTTLLGGIITRNTLVMYDREHSRIGFWKTNCSELWKMPHLLPPDPFAHSSLNKTQNRTADVTANPAPMPPDHGVQIGKIIFSMSSSMNVWDLKPHLVELAQFIAHQLNINVTQIHLLSIKSIQNGSLIKWAILPPASRDYISTSTAKDIISWLSEHRVQLPDSYGSYQFTDWHIKSRKTGTWQQKHIIFVILAMTLTLLAGLSFWIAWILWRWRYKKSNAYMHYGMKIGEQELQPLK
ncbi:hypothetical protein SAY86_013586 [Trapa natans]|uniref:Peptidase A1 domain-containing protein n=1 Tax=Trapa natans TaxID=22666 RepID=A0AAN7QMQ9_TRANT|nr:hypothetical protein SAY86_013586 [Trapa natans]